MTAGTVSRPHVWYTGPRPVFEDAVDGHGFALENLITQGFTPHVPMWWLMDLFSSSEPPCESIRMRDESVIASCKYLIRIAGKSQQADRDCAIATRLQVPVIHGMRTFVERYGKGAQS